MRVSTHPKYPELIGVRAVSVQTGFRVQITFTDGTDREIDLEPYLWGPVFEPIRNDPQLFAAVRVDEVGGTICWPNGADIAPETLYYGDGPAPWEQERQRGHKKTARRMPRSKVRSRVAVR